MSNFLVSFFFILIVITSSSSSSSFISATQFNCPSGAGLRINADNINNESDPVNIVDGATDCAWIEIANLTTPFIQIEQRLATSLVTRATFFLTIQNVVLTGRSNLEPPNEEDGIGIVFTQAINGINYILIKNVTQRFHLDVVNPPTDYSLSSTVRFNDNVANLVNGIYIEDIFLRLDHG